MRDYVGVFVEINIEFGDDGLPTAGTVFSKNLSLNGDVCWTIRCFPRGAVPGDDDEYLAVHLVNLGGAARKAKVVFDAIALRRANDDDAASGTASQPLTTRCDFDYPNKGDMVILPQVFRTSNLAEHCVVDGYVTLLCGLAVLQHSPIPVPPSRHVHDLRRLVVRNPYGDPDVSFAVGDKLVPANRKVLAARSPVFKAELAGAMAESTAPVVRPPHEFDAATFVALLHYVYTDRIPRSESEVAGLGSLSMVELLRDLLAAADWFAMDRLKLVCARKLWEDVSVETVSKTLYYAERYNCRELRNACIHFMTDAGKMRHVAVTEEYVWLAQNYPSLIDKLRQRIIVEKRTSATIRPTPYVRPRCDPNIEQWRSRTTQRLVGPVGQLESDA